MVIVGPGALGLDMRTEFGPSMDTSYGWETPDVRSSNVITADLNQLSPKEPHVLLLAYATVYCKRKRTWNIKLIGVNHVNEKSVPLLLKLYFSKELRKILKA